LKKGGRKEGREEERKGGRKEGRKRFIPPKAKNTRNKYKKNR
jgi:hypothetical protein